MYIDTDITMALIGLDDALFTKINLDEINNKKTSIMTIFEIKDILSEMDISKDIKEIFYLMKKEKIEILPLTIDVLQKSIELLNKYDRLILLDLRHAVHASHCILLKETMFSTDPIYNRMGEIKYKNPEGLENMGKENIDNYFDF